MLATKVTRQIALGFCGFIIGAILVNVDSVWGRLSDDDVLVPDAENFISKEEMNNRLRKIRDELDRIDDRVNNIATTLPGSIVQVVYHQRQDEVLCRNPIPLDNNPRTSAEGTLVLTKSITPTSNSNILRIEAIISYGNTSGQCVAILMNGNTVLATTVASYHDGGGAGSPPPLVYYMTNPGIDEITFNVNVGAQGDGILNTGTNSGPLNHGTLISSLTISEIQGGL